MKKFLFRTNATMKEYNSKKYWIDKNIIKDITIQAENIPDALKKYQNFVNEKCFISISDNAIKNKSPMYIDIDGKPLQCGYVITGKTEFQDNSSYKWISQYIDLWINIDILSSVFEE